MNRLQAISFAMAICWGVWALADDWPQLQHDPQHTGHSPEQLTVPEVPRPMTVGWRVDFLQKDPPEHISRVTQVIAYTGRMYVPTLEGNLYALDPATGETLWRFATGEPIAHTAAAVDGKVFVATLAGSVFAVETETGRQAWRWSNGRRTGFSSAVLMADGRVFVTGRGGDVHALACTDGSEIWSAQIDAPIYQTAAWDDGRIIFAAEDMHAYALSAADGHRIWKSAKLSGMSFRDYYPLVYKGTVVLEAQPAWSTSRILGGGLGDGWFPISWRSDRHAAWLAEHGQSLAQGKLDPQGLQDILSAQQNQLDLLKAEPRQILRFALDAETGQQPFILPFWIQSMCGNQPPPVVDADGMLIGPVMFINAAWGRIDFERQRYVDVLYQAATDRGRRPGMGNPDEVLNLSTAGKLIFAVHWQESNAQFTGFFDLRNHAWTALPEAVPSWYSSRLRAHNAQCGNNAASIAYGGVYHQAYNVVHNWQPAKP